MLVFNNYSCKNRKSKLRFGDRVAVLNVFLYQTGGSTRLKIKDPISPVGTLLRQLCGSDLLFVMDQ
jgi:hypothetical protein